MTDPKNTLALLDELASDGFDDEAFWRIHHFRATTGEHHPIARHRCHCKKTSSFSEGSTNDLVHQRLRWIRDGYEANPSQSFIALADAAWEAIPHLPKGLRRP